MAVTAQSAVVLNGEGLLDPLNTSAASAENAPDVAGNNGHFIAVWSSNRNTGGFLNDFDILQSQSFDGGATWSDAAPLLAAMNNDAVDDLRPSIATDGQGNWMVNWSRGEGPVPYTVSIDNGATWAAPKTWSTIPGYIGDTSLSYTAGAFVAAATVSRAPSKGSDYTYWIHIGITKNVGFCWGITTGPAQGSPAQNPPVVLHTGLDGQLLVSAGLGDLPGSNDTYYRASNDLGRSWIRSPSLSASNHWIYPQTGPVAMHLPSGYWRSVTIVRTKRGNGFTNSEYGIGSVIESSSQSSPPIVDVVIAKTFTQSGFQLLPPPGRQPTIVRDSSGLSVFTFTPWGFRYSTDDGVTWAGPEGTSGGSVNETLATDHAGNWVSLYTRNVTDVGSRIAWRRLEATAKQRYKGVPEGEGEGVPEGQLEGAPEGEGGDEGEEEEIDVLGTAYTVLAAWQSTDTNGDLRITPEEYTAAFGDHLDVFSLLDTSNDNLLSIPELQRHIPFDKPIHDADSNADRRLQLPELLRVIQLYNGLAYRCATNVDDSEDGYEPEPFVTIECNKHAADHACDGDGVIDLSELLRVIQLFRFEMIIPCESEDGFCAGKPA